jgi:hypothetical protein
MLMRPFAVISVDRYSIPSKDKEYISFSSLKLTKLNSVALVRDRTIPTEPLPLVGEVSDNFCG